jgi:hypothetical protein
MKSPKSIERTVLDARIETVDDFDFTRPVQR